MALKLLTTTAIQQLMMSSNNNDASTADGGNSIMMQQQQEGDGALRKRTEAWLDRARGILSNTSNDPVDVERQLRELEDLIREGSSTHTILLQSNKGQHEDGEDECAAAATATAATITASANAAIMTNAVPPCALHQQQRQQPSCLNNKRKLDTIIPDVPHNDVAATTTSRNNFPSSPSPPSLNIPSANVTNKFLHKDEEENVEETEINYDALQQSRLPTFEEQASVSLPQTAPPTTTTTLGNNNNKDKPLRRGKWATEEELYVNRIIQDFNQGYLDAPSGTTLRSYLSMKLHCDPMRITKKFTGDCCIGKRVYHPIKIIMNDSDDSNNNDDEDDDEEVMNDDNDVNDKNCNNEDIAQAEERGTNNYKSKVSRNRRNVNNNNNNNNRQKVKEAQLELIELERGWKRRLYLQEMELHKKAIAAAAAATAAASVATSKSTSIAAASAAVDSADSATVTANTVNRTNRNTTTSTPLHPTLPFSLDYSDENELQNHEERQQQYHQPSSLTSLTCRAMLSLPHLSEENRHVVTRTATWLCRADTILLNTSTTSTISAPPSMAIATAPLTKELQLQIMGYNVEEDCNDTTAAIAAVASAHHGNNYNSNYCGNATGNRKDTTIVNYKEDDILNQNGNEGRNAVRKNFQHQKQQYKDNIYDNNTTITNIPRQMSQVCKQLDEVRNLIDEGDVIRKVSMSIPTILRPIHTGGGNGGGCGFDDDGSN